MLPAWARGLLKLIEICGQLFFMAPVIVPDPSIVFYCKNKSVVLITNEFSLARASGIFITLEERMENYVCIQHVTDI